MRRGLPYFSISSAIKQGELPKVLSKPNNIMDHITHPKVEIGKLIDSYAREAEEKLKEILQSLEKQWPST